MSVRRTSMYDKHVKLNAKMAPFAGWEMPLQYTTVKDEVLAVRQHVGMFDVSHMGEFFVEGPEAINFVDYIICNDFKNAGDNKAVYSPICREDGTVVDDCISYRLSDTKVLICVNASNMQKDWNWISQFQDKFNIKLSNRSEDYSLIAIQGPKTEEILKKVEMLSSENPVYYSSIEKDFRNEKIIMARTGYTGEDGFELFCSHNMANILWDEFFKHGVTPCGLVARDVLRLEVCFPLYGNELNDQITPIDAGLKWTVKLSKQDFVGKKALENYKPKFKQVKLVLEKGIPREHYEICNSSGDVIGNVSSGTMSVVTSKGICLAHIAEDKFPADKNFQIKVRNTCYPATMQNKPFVTGGHK